MLYLIKKLWFLILLLVISSVAFIGNFTQWPLFWFWEQYFLFAWSVIAIGVVFHFVGNALPRKFFWEKHPFASFSWENRGRFYQQKLHVNAWKDKMIDMSKATSSVSDKVASHEMSSKEIASIIQELCVAEVTHWFIIVVSPALLFIMHFGVMAWPLWAVYVLTNLMDIVIQRYNRPRFVSLYEHALHREERRAS